MDNLYLLNLLVTTINSKEVHWGCYGITIGRKFSGW